MIDSPRFPTQGESAAGRRHLRDDIWTCGEPGVLVSKAGGGGAYYIQIDDDDRFDGGLVMPYAWMFAQSAADLTKALNQTIGETNYAKSSRGLGRRLHGIHSKYGMRYPALAGRTPVAQGVLLRDQKIALQLRLSLPMAEAHSVSEAHIAGVENIFFDALARQKAFDRRYLIFDEHPVALPDVDRSHVLRLADDIADRVEKVLQAKIDEGERARQQLQRLNTARGNLTSAVLRMK